MSRIGKMPVMLPVGVKVTVSDNDIIVKGPKGESKQKRVPGIDFVVDSSGKSVCVKRNGDSKQEKAMHGLYRALLQNMVKGVIDGYQKTLRIVGTGYKVELKGKTLEVYAGFAKPVLFQIPQGIELEIPKQSSREFMEFIVRGIDKQLVGETAVRIRRIRPPDLYMGKGIRMTDEKVRQLEGKSFGAK